MAPGGGGNNQNIQLTITVNAQTGALTIQNLTQALQGLGQQLQNAGGAAGGANNQNQVYATGLAQTAGAAYLAKQTLSAYTDIMKESIVQSTMLAARVEVLNDTLNNTSKGLGVSTQAAQGQVAAIRQLGITHQAALTAVLGLERANLDVTQSIRLAAAAQNLSVVANMSGSQALETLTQATLSQNLWMLRQFGIVRNVNEVFVQFAATLGKNVNSLTSTERAQATLNIFLKEGEKLGGAYSESMSDAGTKMKHLEEIIIDAKVALGNAFLPVLNAVAGAAISFGKALSEAFNPVVVRVIVDFGVALTAAVGFAVTFTAVLKGVNFMLAAMAGEMAITTAGLSVLVGLIALVVSSEVMRRSTLQDSGKIAAEAAQQEQSRITQLKELNTTLEKLYKAEKDLKAIREGNAAEPSGQSRAAALVEAQRQVEALRKQAAAGESLAPGMASQASISGKQGEIKKELEAAELARNVQLSVAKDELLKKEQKITELKQRQSEIQKMMITDQKSITVFGMPEIGELTGIEDQKKAFADLNVEIRKNLGDIGALKSEINSLSDTGGPKKLEFSFRQAMDAAKKMKDEAKTTSEAVKAGIDPGAAVASFKAQVNVIETFFKNAKNTAIEQSKATQGKVFVSVEELKLAREGEISAKKRIDYFDTQLAQLEKIKAAGVTNNGAMQASNLIAKVNVDLLKESANIIEGENGAIEAGAEALKNNLESQRELNMLSAVAMQHRIQLLRLDDQILKAQEPSFALKLREIDAQAQLNIMEFKHQAITDSSFYATQKNGLSLLKNLEIKQLTLAEDLKALAAREAEREAMSVLVNEEKKLANLTFADIEYKIDLTKQDLAIALEAYSIKHAGEKTLALALQAMWKSYYATVDTMRRQDISKDIGSFQSIVESQINTVQANQTISKKITQQNLIDLSYYYDRQKEYELHKWQLSDEAQDLFRNARDVYEVRFRALEADLQSRNDAKRTQDLDQYDTARMSSIHAVEDLQDRVRQAESGGLVSNLERRSQLRALDAEILRLRQMGVKVTWEQVRALEAQIEADTKIKDAQLLLRDPGHFADIEGMQKARQYGASAKAIEQGIKTSGLDSSMKNVQQRVADLNKKLEEGTITFKKYAAEIRHATHEFSSFGQMLKHVADGSVTSWDILTGVLDGAAQAAVAAFVAIGSGESAGQAFKKVIGGLLVQVAEMAAVMGARQIAEGIDAMVDPFSPFQPAPPHFISAAKWFALAAATGIAGGMLQGGGGGGAGGGGNKEAQKFEPTKTKTNVSDQKVLLDQDLSVRGRQLLQAGQQMNLLAGVLTSLMASPGKGVGGIFDWRTMMGPLTDNLGQRLGMISLRQSAENTAQQQILTNILTELKKSNAKADAPVTVSVGIDGQALGTLIDGRVMRKTTQFKRKVTQDVVDSLADNSNKSAMSNTLTNGGV